jgi:carbamoyltransferase
MSLVLVMNQAVRDRGLVPLNSLTAAQWSVLWDFADRLRELGYTESNVSSAMNVADHCLRNYRAWPAHVQSCRRKKAKDPCALLSAFFLIEESVVESELEALLGREVIQLLLDMDFIGLAEAGKLYFRYYLYPLLGTFIITDGCLSNPELHDQVYYLGTDSHTLARLTPRSKVGMALDHCTGSGAHALLAACHSGRSFGLDINPRALQFARFNARLNRLDNVSFLESDCYQNVRPGSLGAQPPCRFDLITANPPFVPSPEKLALFREGGATGEEVTERIVAGLPEMLAADGIFSMITNVPNFAKQTFFQRCEKWLSSDQTWGMVVLSNRRYTSIEYILVQHAPVSFDDYGSYFQSWLDCYESVELESITDSQVYLFRSPYPWRVDRRYGHPTQAVSGFIETWIRSLRSYLPGTSAHYRIQSGLETPRWEEGRSRVYLEWKPDYRWWQPEGRWLEGPAARLLSDFESHPDGLAGQSCDSDALTELLGHHLVTLAG